MCECISAICSYLGCDVESVREENAPESKLEKGCERHFSREFFCAGFGR